MKEGTDMGFNGEQYFNYAKEKRDDILCIDMKSFYASVECVARGLKPLKDLLVVMSGDRNGGGLALSASPMAKSELGISNVTRGYEIPKDSRLHVVPPRMNLYIKVNMMINNIFTRYVADEDIFVYSIDETFVRVKASKKLFNMNAYEFARQFQRDIYHETGLYCTVGIGDNMLLSKLALDNEAKKNPDMIADWRYEDVPNTVWKIKELTDFWGINRKSEQRLHRKGIETIYDLAHYDFFYMKETMGVVGQQLVAHAWGIDRTDISEKYVPKSKIIGNSQVLMRDYHKVSEIKIVIREMAEQVATRIRTKGLQTGCVHLGIVYSRDEQEKGFSRQIKIDPTNDSRVLSQHCLRLFDKFYEGQIVRNVSVTYSKLTDSQFLQLDLFNPPEELIARTELEEAIDHIRRRFGFASIVHASSYLEGASAIRRASLVGGHAGGNDGLVWN